MARILDIRGDWLHEAYSRAFIRKFNANNIANIVGADVPFFLTGFNESAVPGLVFPNEYDPGTSDMTMGIAALVSGGGWYTYPVPSWGYGIGNDGTLNSSGQIPNSSCINLNGLHKVTYIVVFKVFSDGQADAGRICEKAGSQIMFVQNQVGTECEIALSLMDGGWGAVSTTNREVHIGHWHCVMFSVDETQAFGSRGAINFDGRPVAVGDTLGDHIEDPGQPLYMLNESGGGILRDFDGVIGLFCVIPGFSMSNAEFATLLEVRGLFQPVLANQPNAIIAPGAWSAPDYDFIAANNEYLCTFQANPFKTEAGTIIINFIPEDFTNQQELFGLTEEGAANEDELMIQIRGDIANDPIELHGVTGGGIDLRLQIPFGAVHLNVPCQLGISSNGTTTQMVLNGREQVVTPVVGANTGQWFADYPGVNVVCWGDTRSGAGAYSPYDGKSPSVEVFDRGMSVLELQQHYWKNAGAPGHRAVANR